jgi:two-component system nitrogen regulation sensor histidine kinase NtrY
MGFSRFYFFTFLQIVLLAASFYILFWCVSRDFMVVSQIFLLVIIVLQIFGLYNQFIKTNKKLLRFLESFTPEGSIVTFSHNNQDTVFKSLTTAMSKIVLQFENLKIEKESNMLLFTNAISQLKTGVIVFDPKGKVSLINKAAKQIFDTVVINNIKELSFISSELPGTISSLKPGKQSLLPIQIFGVHKEILIKVADMVVNKNKYRLLSLQDIHAELDNKEHESWRRLIQIINHEIVNSLIPINLLTSSLLSEIQEDDHWQSSNLLPDKKEQLISSLQTIQRRSLNLTSFAEANKKAMTIKKPVKSEVDIYELFNCISALFQEELKMKGISLCIDQEEKNKSVFIDSELIEQVLVNLIRNSIEALNGIENGIISLSSSIGENSIELTITDNGVGITKDQLPNIFAPVFSTKKGGLGIGLSLSKQIMKIHKGYIKVLSFKGAKTTFILGFPYEEK